MRFTLKEMRFIFEERGIAGVSMRNGSNFGIGVF
jgi:hypothetical protein